MSASSLKILTLIVLVTCVVSSALEESEKERQIHEIVKRGIFYPQLLFPLNAATGNFTNLQFVKNALKS